MTICEKAAVERLKDLQTLSPVDLIEAINQGLPAALATQLSKKLGLRQEELGDLLRLTPRTLQRRFEEGRLELGESERLWELSALFFRAADVLESETSAVQWLKSPIQALGWKSPLTLARTA